MDIEKIKKELDEILELSSRKVSEITQRLRTKH